MSVKEKGRRGKGGRRGGGEDLKLLPRTYRALFRREYYVGTCTDLLSMLKLLFEEREELSGEGDGGRAEGRTSSFSTHSLMGEEESASSSLPSKLTSCPKERYVLE